MNARIGRLVIPAVDGFRPEPHEIATALRLVAAGQEVAFLVPSNEPGVRTADVVIDVSEWEMKSPTGHGRHTISHQLERGRRQSERVILDTNRTPLSDLRIVAEVHRRMRTSERPSHVWVVTKSGVIVRLRR